VVTGTPQSDSESSVGKVVVVEHERWQVACLLRLADSGEGRHLDIKTKARGMNKLWNKCVLACYFLISHSEILYIIVDNIRVVNMTRYHIYIDKAFFIVLNDV